MQPRQADQIKVKNNNIYHRSAGGFVFFEEPKSCNLFVALIKPENEVGLFIPKGHLKVGESSRDAAEREICEELSLHKKPTLIARLGVENYSFNTDDTENKNFKKVSLFVFSLASKEKLTAPKSENIDESLWVEFDDAYNRLTYDKDNLIKARELFYLSKNRTS